MKLLELLQDWQNGPVLYRKGQKLEIAKDDEAQELVDQSIAKAIDPPASTDDKIVVSKENMAIMIEKAVADAVTALKTEATKKLGPTKDSSDDNDTYWKTGGYGSFGKFCQDVAWAERGRFSDVLQKWNAKTAGIMAESDNSQGGYLVPTEFSARLLSTMLEAAFIEPKCQFVPMQTNSITFPAIVATTHASSLFGGIIIYRTAEESQKTKTKPKFGQVQLNLHNLTGLIYVTNQLLEDSPISIEPLVYDLFGRAIVWQKEDDYLNGTGAGMALGILNSPCLVSVAKETGQAAATIVTANIVKMWSRLHPASRGNAVWLCNTDCLPQLLQLSLAVGTGGSAVYLPPGGLSNSPYGSLLGRPMIDTEHCQTLGTVGDIYLADFTQYLTAGKAGQAIKTAASMHLRFDYNEMAFRIETRYDGQPWWSSPLTPKNSANTLSPFVALATRA